MRLGINSVFTHETPEQWAEILSKRGLQAASFPVNFEAKDHVINAYEKAFQDYNITIAEVGIWNSPFTLDEKEAAKNRDICKHQLELADAIKAKCCVNVSGAVGKCWYGCYPENYTEDCYKRNVEFVQKILSEVNPQNTFYTLEIMQWMVPDSTESYLRLMKDIQHDRFAVHFDPVNLVNSAKTAMFYTQYRDEAIQKLALYIKSCHVKDFMMKQGLTVQIEETIPGTGIAEIPSYVQQINTIDPEMPMLLEHLRTWEEYDQAISYIFRTGGRGKSINI